jgi:hypothetical protein
MAGAREAVALGPRPVIVWSSMTSNDSAMIQTVAKDWGKREA